MNGKWILGLLAAVLMFGLAPAAHAAGADDGAEPLIVFAASSLAPPLEEIARAYTKETGLRIRLSYASSAVLARQIERGAPAGLFISAHDVWLDHLIDAGAIAAGDSVVIAGNRLVLATRSKPTGPTDMPGLELLKNLKDGERLAIGAPATVPLGIYAREALTALGYWQHVEGHLAETASARAAVALVRSGAARYGILYASDIAVNNLIALADFPPGSHGPILYRSATIRRRGQSGPSPGARMFLDFLASEPARAIFEDFGFTVSTE